LNNPLGGVLPVIPPPLSGIGINDDIAFAEQGERCPVVGFEVQHALGE
jgi:hypothetical protein